MSKEKSPALREGHGEDNLPVPGIGTAGVVMCPYFRGPCLKGGCELWVELNYGKTKVARCSIAWQSLLAVEVRQSIDRLTKVVNNEPAQ